MVDVIIEAAATATSQFMRQSMNGRDVVDVGSKRYVFYIYNDGLTLDYKLSLDSGETYGSAVNIYNNATDPIKKLSIHFDQWTDNDFGKIIHIALLAGGAGGPHTDYYTLDTASDVLTGPVDFLPSTGGSVSATVGWVGANRSALSLTKARTGLLHAIGWIDNGATDGFHSVSTDGIVWDDATHQSLQDATPTEGSSAVKLLAVPGNDGADDDIWVIIMDATPVVKVRFYDFSLRAWNAATTVQAITTNSDVYFMMAVTQYFSTGSFFLVFWSDFNVGSADYHCYELVNSTTFTLRTDIVTNFGFSFGAGIFCDQATGDLYACHLNGSPELTVSVFQNVNTNGGVGVWTRTQYDVGAADDHRWLATPPSGSTTGARWQLVWRNDAQNDIITDFDEKTEVGDVPTPPPAALPLPPLVPGGGSANRALSGSAGGFLTYITPDGREYPLHTPHDFGRWVVSFSGFGTPPIQYITQRGPFQDGETVRDFFLRPRVIQLLIRQGFINRSEWWQGRASLLNEIRPNRQTTSTAALPGQLRVVQTDGTIRDFNVFISEGPRFEPRLSSQWDEHAFQEVLRFIAHDPVAFDPATVTVAFVINVDAELVFPITFDTAVATDNIIFGAGLVDDTQAVTYLGTWEEFPIITIEGPFDDFRLDNVTTGEKIEFGADIAPDRTVTINLRPGFKTVVDDLGNNLIGIVTSDSDLATWHLAPDPEAPGGVNSLRLRGTNPTGGSSVTLTYLNRYFGF